MFVNTAILQRSFAEFNLGKALLSAIDDEGYELPTPVQAEIIPHIAAGRDVIGQAQTGTGKTAAFALPLLNRLQLGRNSSPQVLVLTPTRELALQVAESFQAYGRYLRNLNVAAIFGGQDYGVQYKQLANGAHVVVGTPGRVMDHIRQGSLDLSAIRTLVLDEADEMLKMGFLDDVAWIVEQIPEQRQIALFSATMPADIRKIADRYLIDPVEVAIKAKTMTATTINQRYMLTPGLSRKFEALTRILETETTEGVLVFVRTKIQTLELAEQLVELGYACAPLSGDIAQNQRLRTVEQLKSGKLNILVATDVAARGLDVERISHVINYDIPFDSEAYIHRIGRTGRAGRSGEAILFLNPREKQMLKTIEKATRQKIAEMQLPTVSEINIQRIERFKEQIRKRLTQDNSTYAQMLHGLCKEESLSLTEVAAALAALVKGDNFLLIESEKRPVPTAHPQEMKSIRAKEPRKSRGKGAARIDEGMESYRVEVGEEHGVRPANIVGAIANEGGIDSKYIGRIDIHADYSIVDLPVGLPQNVLKILQKARVFDRMLRISRESDSQPQLERKKRKPVPEHQAAQPVSDWSAKKPDAKKGGSSHRERQANSRKPRKKGPAKRRD